MSVTLCFTLDPLRSWRMYQSEANKASGSIDSHIERTLDTESSSHLLAETTAPLQKKTARIDVSSCSNTEELRSPKPPTEQAALAARMRQDILFFSTARHKQGEREKS